LRGTYSLITSSILKRALTSSTASITQVSSSRTQVASLTV
jgi:hypothetical protein